MSIQGWYYLHQNGDLIYKRELGETAADIRESPFAKMLWPFDPSDRQGAWTILVESLACGANKNRVTELAQKWCCDNADAQNYVDRIGARIFMDGNAWCATRRDFVDLQKSPAGFGETALEALAALCKELKLKPSKMWGNTFEKLLNGV